MTGKAQGKAWRKLAVGETDVPGASPARSVPTKRKPWRVAVLALVLLTLSFAIALVIGELFIRLFAPQQLVLIRPDIWQPADSIGWVNRPNVRTQVNTGERTVSFVTDAEGFRIGTAAGPAHDSSKRVLIIGDSFMQALQVDHEQTVTALLDRRVSEALGTGVAVKNAAVAGWDPPQYLIRARSLLPRRRWDLLLVTLYTGNDIVSEPLTYVPPRSPAPGRGFRAPQSLSWNEFVSAWLYPVNNWLDEHSQLFVFGKSRLATLRMRLGLTAESVPTELLRSEAGSARWDVTADICLEIQRLAARNGVPVVFAVIPAHYQIAPERFRAYVEGFGVDTASVDLNQPNRLLDAALQKRGLTVVDPLEQLRAAQRSGELYGRIDHHFSPRGHEAFEEAIRPSVLAALRRAPPRVNQGPTVSDGSRVVRAAAPR